jgi:hypothetical protein
MACRVSNSSQKWTHLKPNAIGNRLGPSEFPLPAPQRSCEPLSTGCNFLPVAKSMPIAPKLELNTIQKAEKAQPWAKQLMDQCHERALMTSYFSIRMKKNQNVRSMSLKLKGVTQSKL